MGVVGKYTNDANKTPVKRTGATKWADKGISSNKKMQGGFTLHFFNEINSIFSSEILLC